MKNALKFMMLGVFVVLTSQFVSAYHNGYAHNSQGTRYVFGFDGDFFAQDYRYVDYYGRPIFRVYENRRGNGELSNREKVRAVRFLEHSFNDRYAITSGKSSGDAFCQGCKIQNPSPFNFGNKPAFNLLASGNNQNNYYYKPVYDYNLGRFNWRF